MCFSAAGQTCRCPRPGRHYSDAVSRIQITRLFEMPSLIPPYHGRFALISSRPSAWADFTNSGRRGRWIYGLSMRRCWRLFLLTGENCPQSMPIPMQHLLFARAFIFMTGARFSDGFAPESPGMGALLARCFFGRGMLSLARGIIHWAALRNYSRADDLRFDFAAAILGGKIGVHADFDSGMVNFPAFSADFATTFSHHRGARYFANITRRVRACAAMVAPFAVSPPLLRNCQARDIIYSTVGLVHTSRFSAPACPRVLFLP